MGPLLPSSAAAILLVDDHAGNLLYSTYLGTDSGGAGIAVDLHFDVAASMKEMGCPYVTADLLFYFHRSRTCRWRLAVIIVIGGI